MAKSKKQKDQKEQKEQKERHSSTALADAALVAFGQGTGRIGIDEEALAFLRESYASDVALNENRIRRRYWHHLAASRDMGLLARQVADAELGVTITLRHVERARRLFAGTFVPCPICPARE